MWGIAGPSRTFSSVPCPPVCCPSAAASLSAAGSQHVTATKTNIHIPFLPNSLPADTWLHPLLTQLTGIGCMAGSRPLSSAWGCRKQQQHCCSANTASLWAASRHNSWCHSSWTEHSSAKPSHILWGWIPPNSPCTFYTGVIHGLLQAYEVKICLLQKKQLLSCPRDHCSSPQVTPERGVTLLASLSQHLQIIIYLHLRLQGDLWCVTFWEWQKSLGFFTVTSWWRSANTDILKDSLLLSELCSHSPWGLNQDWICLAPSQGFVQITCSELRFLHDVVAWRGQEMFGGFSAFPESWTR